MSRKLSKKRRDQRKPSGKSFKKALAIARRAARENRKSKIEDRKSPRSGSSTQPLSPVTLKIHPLAELLPPMTSPEYEALKADIAANGQRDDATLYENQILDGRHRQRVCDELKIPLRTRNFSGSAEEAVRFIYSKAVHRNLTESQKACAAVSILDKLQVQTKARSLANLKRGAASGPWPLGFVMPIEGESMAVKSYNEGLVSLRNLDPDSRGVQKLTMPVEDLCALIGETATNQPHVPTGEAREQAGTLFGVSGKYITEARRLREADAKLFTQVFHGALPLSQAIRSIHRQSKANDLAARAQGVELSFPLGLIHGDCLKEMEKMPAHSFRLAFADPPYNIGIDYGRGAKADQISEDKYQDWCQKWMSELHRLLSKDGTLWVLINDEHASMFDVELHSAGFTRRAWIKWYETFGVNCSKNFNRTSRHLFYCVKDENDFVFHASAFNRKSDRQTKYPSDKRANPAGKNWDDVWTDIPRLVDNSKERVPGFPTQLPLALVLPILEGCSDRGDKVIDPFNGSGTTAHAAMLTGRIPTTIDIVKRNIEWTELRLKAAIGDNPSIADSAAKLTEAA